MIEAFNKLKKALQEIPEIEDVKLFNNQLRYIDDRSEGFCFFPACFIEFRDIEYQTGGGESQTGSGFARIHIAEFDLEKPDEDRLKLKTIVHKKIQTLKTDDLVSSFNRVREEMDPDYTSLGVFIMDYEFSFVDNSAMDERIDARPLEFITVKL